MPFNSMRPALLVLLVCTCVAAAVQALPPYTLLWALSEAGPIQIASTMFLMFAAIGAGLMARYGWWRDGWMGSFILAAMAAREMDLHKAFTEISVTKIRFFTSPHEPLIAKLIAAAVLSALLLIVIVFIRRTARSYLVKLRAGRDPWAWSVAAAIIAVPASKAMDSGLRIAKHIEPSLARFSFVSEAIEECLELGLAVLFFLAVLQAMSPFVRRTPA